MTQWQRGIGDAVRMTLACAAAGALVGVLIEVINDTLPGGLPMASLVDLWPPMLAIVGFLCGVVFSSVRTIAGDGRVR